MMIGSFIRSLFSYALFGLLSILFAVPAIIFLLIPARWRYESRFLFLMANLFYWAAIKCSLLPVTWIGWENLPNEPVVFAANHQSSLDIPLVGVLARSKPHIWLALKELIDRSYILRFILPRVGVLVDTSSQPAAARSLIKTIDIVNDNKNLDIMIFPEGGRFIDGSVHEFLGGFAILAKKTERPIVPVRIFGANKVYPPGTFLIHWHPIKVVIGKPMCQEDEETLEAFRERVYEWFVKQEG